MATQVVSENGAVDQEQKLKDQRQQLHQHFMSLPSEQHSHAWDSFWRQEITPWDRDQPQPALVDALRDKPGIFGSAFKDVSGKKTRRRVLVPGCGRGYDVLLFSSYGFNSVGLDISPTASEEAKKFQASLDLDQQYPAANAQEGRGEARFITADFFMDNFLSESHGSPDGDRKFDLIYDYTFLCALPPAMRPQWAARMSELLSPTGRLICMEYPLGKDPKSGGPPHGLVPEIYEQLLAKPGSDIKYGTDGKVVPEEIADKPDNALVQIEHWKPERVFQGQENQVIVSVWKHVK